MSDFALDKTTHDLVIERGDFVLVEKGEDVAQAIKIRLLIMLGEWFLDTSLGVDYLGRIFQPGRAYGLKADELRAVVRNTKGVQKVRSLTFAVDTVAHLATVKFEYTDEFGNEVSATV